MNIGIYAGTFDPIHQGHLLFASRAIQQADLAKVIIVAEKQPYRKQPKASWDHRQAMIERACQSMDHIDHDYAFASALSHQHTMQNMLSACRAHYGDSVRVFFLVGSDVFEHMHQWHDMSDSPQIGGFVVAKKGEHTDAWIDEKLTALKDAGMRLPVIMIEGVQPDLNSSIVRQHPSLDTPGAVPEVIAYVQAHSLYSYDASSASS